MMTELCFHIQDLVQNSAAAGEFFGAVKIKSCPLYGRTTISIFKFESEDEDKILSKYAYKLIKK